MAAALAAPVAPVRASTPRPRHAYTSSSASATGARPTAANSGRRLPRAGGPAAGSLSDPATQALIRRTLLGDKAREAQTPIEELLPPLTSRNDVDLQLYAFLAIILREFVQKWYSSITPDESFVAEIIQIVAHCTRALEERFRKLDLESLLLDELPDLLNKHVTAYRTAHRPVSRPPLEVDPRAVYHSLCPLPALSPVPRADDPTLVTEQLENEAAYRQLLVQAVLTVLLPTEDLENPCLTALVGQIFSELIIGNVVANKATQPWLLYEGVCITARVLGEQKARAKHRIVSGKLADFDVAARKTQGWTVQGVFIMMIQLVILAFTSVRFLVTTLVMSSSLPPRTPPGEEEKKIGKASSSSDDARVGTMPLSTTSTKVPVLAFSIWSCAGNLMELSSCMPWLSGLISFMQFGAIRGPGRVAGYDGPLDRLLSHYIQTLFKPSHLPPLLRTLRGVLFPNNAPGTPTLFPPSSDDELRALRRRAANALWGLLPKGVARVYFGGRLWRGQQTRGSGGVGGGGASGDDDRGGGGTSSGTGDERAIDELEGLLIVVGDEYCNKHLVYSILELLIVRLMPEISDKGVTELWDQRLG